MSASFAPGENAENLRRVQQSSKGIPARLCGVMRLSPFTACE
jgi:hypothetical protein